MPNQLSNDRRPNRPGKENRNRHQRRNHPKVKSRSGSESSSSRSGGAPGYRSGGGSSFSFDAPLTDQSYERQLAQYNAEELNLENNAADAKAASASSSAAK